MFKYAKVLSPTSPAPFNNSINNMSNIPTINEIDNNSPSQEIKDVVSAKVNQPSYVEVQETLSVNAAIDEVDNTRKPTISEIYKIVTDGLFESTTNWWDYAYRVSQAQINQDIIDRLDKGEIGGGYSKGVDIITTTSSKIPTNSNVYSALKSDSLYPKKLVDEEINGIYDFLNGITIGKPTSYTGGTWSLDSNDRTHLTTDYLYVRLKAIFEQLQILDVDTIGGKLVVSPAGSIRIAYVDNVTVTIDDVEQNVYRCYFLGEQDGDAIDNKWKVGDQAQAKSFNVKKGTYHKRGNHYLWRLVVGVSEDTVTIDDKRYHYVDLSQLVFDAGSEAPAPGDVLNQLGHRGEDTQRKTAIVVNAVDNFAPSITLYADIDDFTLLDKEYVDYGVYQGKAFFNVYGDMYVGDKGINPTTYIKYKNGKIDIKANLEIGSSIDGKDLNTYIKDNAGVDEETVINIINNAQVIKDLQKQTDGAIETWFYAGIPTLNNLPASDWTTTELKNVHVGDLYYDQTSGYAYRFTRYADDITPYAWNRIKDNDIVTALNAANDAQDTADSKMKVFYGETLPTDYQAGDIWVNATIEDKFDNDILRATTDSKTFNIEHWVLASRYSAAIKDLLIWSNEYTTKFDNLTETVKQQKDQSITNWFYEYEPTIDNAPANEWTTGELRKEHIGDIFYDTKNNHSYRWTGSTWIIIKDADFNEAMEKAKEAADAAGDASDLADKKRQIFYSDTTPTGADRGDLWMKQVGDKTEVWIFDGTNWVKSNDKALADYADTINTELEGIKGQIDGKAETWYQDTDPSTNWTADEIKANHEGDIWYNTTDGTTQYWNGSEWQQMDIPKDVFDTIDGKSSIFVDSYEDAKASRGAINKGYKTRDLWILPADATVNNEKYYEGDILTSTADGIIFNEKHWIKKVRYVGSEELTNVINVVTKKIENITATTLPGLDDRFNNFTKDGVLDFSEKARLTDDLNQMITEIAAVNDQITSVTSSPYLKNNTNKGKLEEAQKTLNVAWSEYKDYITKLIDGTTTISKVSIAQANSEYSSLQNALSSVKQYITLCQGDLLTAIGTDIASYQYLKNAMTYGKTSVIGGLILSSAIELKDIKTDGTIGDVTAGINGVTNGLKSSIASWYGGPMVDRVIIDGSPDTWESETFKTTPGTDYAMSLFRHDGSGYLAGGKIWWEAGSGDLHVTPNSFVLEGKDIALYLLLFQLNFNGNNTWNSLMSATPQRPFTNLRVLSTKTANGITIGEKASGGRLIIGNIVLSNEANSNVLEITNLNGDNVAHLGVSGGISAYGTYIPSTGGGGLNGSVVPYASIIAGNYTDADLSSIPNAYSIKALYNKIENIDVSGQLVNYLTRDAAAILYQPVGSYASASHNHDSVYSKLGHTHSQYLTSTSLDGYATEQWVLNKKYLTAHQSLADYYTIDSVDELLSAKADASDIPTKVGQLTNDKGYLSAITKAQVEGVLTGNITSHTHSQYLTSHQSLKGYATETWVNDKGYTTNTGTVTSVKITLPTGLSLGTTKEITTSGTFAISLTSGYSIPTTAKQTDWDGAVTAKHSHSNKTVIDGISSTNVSNWNTAYNNNHTHSNKSVLDGISSTNVSNWTSAYNWYTLMTTDEATPDDIINKWNEVVSFLAGINQTDTLDGIVSGINTSISNEVTRAKAAEQANATNISTNATNISTNKTNISTLQGYFTSGSAKKALQLTNSRSLWGNSFNGTADINGSIVVPSGKYISIGNIKLEYDSTNKALKVTNTTTNEVANLYTSGGISAYGASGVSSSGGGGLNGNVKSYADAVKLSSESLSEIASAYSIKMLSDRIGTLEGAGYITSVSWNDILSKPSTFTPSAHTHGYASSVKVGQTEYKISGNTISIPAYPTSLPASDVYSWAKASAKPSYTWSEIGSKPTTFTPSAHTHSEYLTDHQTVDNKAVTLAWGTSKTIATIGGTDITVTLPANPNTNTHYTAGLYVGATGTKSNAATSNGGTYLKLYEESTKRSEFKIVGSGATTVSSDANGNITISSTDTNTNTWRPLGTGADQAAAGNHTHTFASLTSKPTTLDGYGITDAKIASGVITIGKNTITPLTSHQSLSGYVNSITTSGSGNAVTSITKNGSSLTFTKGTTFLTSHQSLANYYTKTSVDSLLAGKSNTSHTHTQLNTAFYFKNEDISETAENLSNTANVHAITFYRNGFTIPYQMENTNDGGMFRVRGASESSCICEIATWDDSGAGETIQFNYYPTTSRLTPTHSVVVPKTSGTIALTKDIPTNTNQLTNGAGYITSSGSCNYATSAGSANSVAWTNVSGRPTKVSQFTNDSGYLTSHQSLTAYLTKTDASSLYQPKGNYLTAHQSLTDYAKKTDLPSVGNGTVTITQGGTTKGSFTMNQSGNTTIALTDNNTNTWRGITDSYSGTDSATSLSQKGGNALYNALVNGYASSAGNITNASPQLAAATESNSIYVSSPTYKIGDPVKKLCFDWYGNYWALGNIRSGDTPSQGFGVYYKDTNVATFKTINAGDTVSSLTIDKVVASSFVGNATSASKLATSRTIWGQSFNGEANVSGALSGATTISASSTISTSQANGGIKINGVPISALSSQLIFNTGTAIRFGETAWNWDQWAGLKYDHSSKTIYLGIADGTVFEANNAQSGGILRFPGIAGAYFPGWFSCSGNIGATSLELSMSAPFIDFHYNNGSSDYDVRLINDASGVLKLEGNFYATGGITAYQTSDARLKNNITKLNCLNVIKSIGGTYEFDYLCSGEHSVGFIAQNVNNPLLTDIVEKDDDGYLKINYWSPKLISLAFGAITEVDDEVSRLKARVTFLEGEVERLTQKDKLLN
uniref:Chaperone of endosialidase n=1 Tax=Geladintestivirus 4 TaxID=3233136 RepID=A0AAU8MJE0_9CAUD